MAKQADKKGGGKNGERARTNVSGKRVRGQLTSGDKKRTMGVEGWERK